MTYLIGIDPGATGAIVVMAALLAMTKAQPKGVLFSVLFGLAPRFILRQGVVRMETTLIRTIKVIAISRSVMALGVKLSVYKAKHKLK